MSEETKTDGDYVVMGAGAGVTPGRGGATGAAALKLDDPNLSQEEKDHRLALALQQQENSAAMAEHKKRHDQAVKAQQNRTLRSGTYTKLAAIRDKDSGMLSVPAEYTSENAYKKSDGDYFAPTGSSGFVPPGQGARPQEVADFKLAAEIQTVEQVDAGTVRTMKKMLNEEHDDEEARAHRTERSNYHINQKGIGK